MRRSLEKLRAWQDRTRAALRAGRQMVRTRMSWRPDPDGLAFRRWVCDRVLDRDGAACRRCGLEGHHSAHVFGLGMGASRYDWRDWRNWPSANVRLCRDCHQRQDQGGGWPWSEAGVDVIAAAAAAKAECATHAEAGSLAGPGVRPW